MVFQKHYYPHLDAFRGIAVVWVYLHHINIFFDLKNIFPPEIYTFLRPLCLSGYLGVDMFFVISGFLITGLLTEDLDRNAGIGRFYVRRFFKIVPQYLLVILPALWLSRLLPCDFLNFYHFTCPSVQPVASHVFFLQNYLPEMNPALAHTWSLSIEEHFYWIYPIILGLIWNNIPAAKRLTAAAWAAGGIILASNILRFINFNLHQPLLTFGSGIPFQTTLLRCDGLMIGCLIKLFEPQITKRLASLHLRWIVIIGAFMIYALFLIPFFHQRDQVWAYYLFASLAPAGLIAATLTSSARAWSKPWAWIGKNSYAIYLWHYPLIFPFVFIPEISQTARLALYSLTALAAGVLSTRFIEKSFLKLRNKICP